MDEIQAMPRAFPRFAGAGRPPGKQDSVSDSGKRIARPCQGCF